MQSFYSFSSQFEHSSNANQCMLNVARYCQPLLCALLCMLAAAPAWAENINVWVVLSENSAPYLSFAEKFKKDFPTSVQVSVLESPDALPSSLSSHSKSPVDLIVAVGMKATEAAAAQTRVPVLAAMVPKVAYDALLVQPAQQKITRPISAIYLNQPWARRINFWQAVSPTRLRIGLLYTQELDKDITLRQQELEHRGGVLVTQLVNTPEELFVKLESVLASSDVLFALSDSMIYSNSNIRHILLASYRRGIPLVGLSQAYVNAGALCAIFSTPEQIAVQAKEAALAFAKTRSLPPSQHPTDFTIAVNEQVARSLKIELPAADVIRSRMEKIASPPSPRSQPGAVISPAGKVKERRN